MTAPLPSDLLDAERDALGQVAACARAQLDALRAGEAEAFQAAADRTMAAVSDLERRQTIRTRHADRAAIAPDARAALRAAAEEARTACDDLEFALGHALALSRDLLGAWHQMTAPAAGHVYTAAGQIAPTEGAAHLNQTG